MTPDTSEPGPSTAEGEPDDRGPGRTDRRLFGVYVGVVLDNQDPSQLGRVLVHSPTVSGPKSRGQWARVAVPRAGTHHGTWLVPDVGDEILLAFEAGELDRPYVIGSLWGPSHAPPEQMVAGNPVTSIVSPAGSRLTVDDRPDRLSIRLATPGGRSVTLADDAGGSITLDDGNGGMITMTASGIEIRTSATVKVSASAIEMTAGSVRFDTGMIRASGVVKCDTLIATSVVASSYTPGAGNIM
jgi:uncharacterized protein involved in type VI secretion and phage assembly